MWERDANLTWFASKAKVPLRPGDICTYADSSWADVRKSTNCHFFWWNHALVHWRSKNCKYYGNFDYRSRINQCSKLCSGFSLSFESWLTSWVSSSLSQLPIVIRLCLHRPARRLPRLSARPRRQVRNGSPWISLPCPCARGIENMNEN